MAISKVYQICNAYESGYGHGYNNDGKDDDYYSDSELNEAYKIGYRAGYDDFLSKEDINFPSVTTS
jgi:hypothetical protein